MKLLNVFRCFIMHWHRYHTFIFPRVFWSKIGRFEFILAGASTMLQGALAKRQLQLCIKSPLLTFPPLHETAGCISNNNVRDRGNENVSSRITSRRLLLRAPCTLSFSSCVPIGPSKSPLLPLPLPTTTTTTTTLLLNADPCLLSNLGVMHCPASNLFTRSGRVRINLHSAALVNAYWSRNSKLSP